MALTDRHHAVQRDPRPALLVLGNDDVIYDMAVGKILHGPTKVSSVDPEHRGTLADCGREKEDFLVSQVALQAIDEIQFRANCPGCASRRCRDGLDDELG